jgi:hypothetical protein
MFYKLSWHIMQPTKNFSEGSMLPLFGIMENNEHIKKLNLSSLAMHDTRYGTGTRPLMNHLDYLF